MSENKADNQISGYITLSEASHLSGISRDYLNVLIRRGKLRAVKEGNNWLTTKEWFAECRAPREANNNKTNGKYLSLFNAAKMAGVSAGYLNVAVRRGKLRATKLGRNWFTTSEWLAGYQNSVGKNGADLNISKFEQEEKTELASLRETSLAERLQRVESRFENIQTFKDEEISKKVSAAVSSQEIILPSRKLEQDEKSKILETVKERIKTADSNQFQNASKKLGISKSLKSWSAKKLFIASGLTGILLIASLGMATGLFNFSRLAGFRQAEQFSRQAGQANIFSSVFKNFPSDIPQFSNWLVGGISKSISFLNPSSPVLTIEELELGKSKIAIQEETQSSINTLAQAEALDSFAVEDVGSSVSNIISGSLPAQTGNFVLFDNRLSLVETRLNDTVGQANLINSELSLQKKTILGVIEAMFGITALVPRHPISTIVVQGQPATLTTYSIAPQTQTGFDRLSATYLTLASNAEINGTLTVKSGANVNTLHVSDTASIIGNTTIGGNLTASGNSIFNNASTTNATLTNFWATNGTITNASTTYLTVGDSFIGSGGLFSSAIQTPLIWNNGTLTASTTGANPIIFATNSSERMRIDENGNILIATTTIPSGFGFNIATSTYIYGDLTVSNNSIFNNVSTTNASTTNGTITNLWATNGTITNASTTYLTVGSNFWSNDGMLSNNIQTSLIWNNGTLTASTTGANPIIFATNSSERMRIDENGNILIATTTIPSGFGFSVATSTFVYGNQFISGGLGVGVATTTSGNLQTSGSAFIGGDLYVSGNSTVLGDSTVIGGSLTDTLNVNSSIISDLIPDQNAVRDLGSTSYYWDNAYISTLTVNSISAASTSIGGTQSATFTINSDNTTADNEDETLIFFRGTVVPNALLTWNSATSSKRFELNQALYINNGSASTTNPTLTVQTIANQTANALQIIDNNGANLFSVNPVGSNTTMVNASTTNATTTTFRSSGLATFGGDVGIGTTGPGYKLDVQGIASFGDYARASYFTATSTSFSSTFPNASTTYATLPTFWSSNANITGGTITGITDLTVSDGGTGASTLSGFVYGNGASAMTATTTPFFNLGFYANGNSTMVNASSTYSTISDTAWINNLVATNATTTTFRSSGLATFGGDVGIGTTGPVQKLHVEGQCVTGDSELITENGGKLRIDQVKGGEYVISLNEETGKLVPAKIKGLLDMGVKPIYKITTEDGRTIRTTANHPYLTEQGWQKIADLDEGTEIAVAREDLAFLFAQSQIQNEESNSQQGEDDNLENSIDIHKLFSFANQINNNSSGDSQQATDNIKYKESGVNIVGVHSYSLVANKLNDQKTSDKNKPDIAMGQFTISSISEPTTNDAKNTWPMSRNISDSVSSLSENKSIDINSDYNYTNAETDVKFVKIAKIELLPSEQVYDIEVEGTHNFVANGIIAHNTYISGNTGIGNTSPSSKLNVQGETSGQYFTATSTSFSSTFPNASSTYLTATNLWSTNGWVNGNAIISNVTGNQTQLAAFSGTNTITPTSTIGLSFISGLGTMATQNANAVSINGGTITGISTFSATNGTITNASSTYLTVSDNIFLPNGVITNANLVNSSLTVNGTAIALGASETVTAAAGTLTGTTLNSTVVSSSLTSLGTIGNLVATNASTTYATIPTFWGTNGNITNASTTYLTVSGSAFLASSTMNGFNICTSDNGVCGSGLTGTQGQLAYFSGANTVVGTSTLFISTAGNVGIGTTSPSEKLEIAGTGTTNGSAVLSLNHTGETSFWSAIKFKDDGTDKWGIVSDIDADGGGVFGIYDYATPGTRFVIKTGGNVGIGTTGPTEALDVRGNLRLGDSTGQKIYSNVAASASYIELYNASTGSMNFFGAYATGDITFATANSATPKVTIKYDGNVGIGTTNPTHLIELDADTYGTVSGWVDSSDRNKKENFTELSNVLLPPVTQGIWTATSTGITIADIEYVQGSNVALSDSELLNRLSLMPIRRFNFINDKEQNIINPGVSVHHIGPTAQDFYKSFGLGAADTNLRATDLAGVALAGIKALNMKFNELASSTSSWQASMTQALLTAKQGSIDLISLNNDLNLNGFSLLNVKSISGFNGLWSIDADGNIMAKSINTQAITVAGSASGVTVYDRGTTQPKCVYVENDIIKISTGACGMTQNIGVSAVIETASAPVTPVIATSTVPISATSTENNISTGTATTTLIIAETPISTSTEPIIIPETATTTATSTP